MTLDDLRSIDFNNVSTWPLPIKVAGITVACVVILFLGWYFLIADELKQFDQEQQKEAGLKETFSGKKALAINLDEYRRQMEEMGEQFGTLLRQLPNKTEVPNLLVDITQAGLGRGLDFVLFKPEKEAPLDFYAELPVSIKVTGTYHELAQFVSDVAALPRIVTVGSLDITADKNGKLSMAAVAKTYRYLEAEELHIKRKEPGKPKVPGAP